MNYDRYHQAKSLFYYEKRNYYVLSPMNREQRKDVMTTELLQLLNLWTCNIKKTV